MPHPLLTKESTLTEDLREMIEDLISLCRKAGDTGVDYPPDEEDTCHYLLWDADHSSLTGALAVMPLSEESAECIAYIRPDMRRKGYFSNVLLAEALGDFPEDYFIFPVREPDPATTAALIRLGAEPDSREYLMELELDPAAEPCTGKEPESFNNDSSSDEPGKIFYYTSDDDSIGSCRLERTSKDSVCLYGVEISPDMRGQGFGSKMIRALSEELKRFGIRRVFLHVGADNLPAVSMYEKAGFRTTETLSFYLF